jgi:hypothetical protein
VHTTAGLLLKVPARLLPALGCLLLLVLVPSAGQANAPALLSTQPAPRSALQQQDTLEAPVQAAR